MAAGPLARIEALASSRWSTVAGGADAAAAGARVGVAGAEAGAGGSRGIGSGPGPGTIPIAALTHLAVERSMEPAAIADLRRWMSGAWADSASADAAVRRFAAAFSVAIARRAATSGSAITVSRELSAVVDEVERVLAAWVGVPVTPLRSAGGAGIDSTALAQSRVAMAALGVAPAPGSGTGVSRRPLPASPGSVVTMNPATAALAHAHAHDAAGGSAAPLAGPLARTASVETGGGSGKVGPPAPLRWGLESLAGSPALPHSASPSTVAMTSHIADVRVSPHVMVFGPADADPGAMLPPPIMEAIHIALEAGAPPRHRKGWGSSAGSGGPGADGGIHSRQMRTMSSATASSTTSTTIGHTGGTGSSGSGTGTSVASGSGGGGGVGSGRATRPSLNTLSGLNVSARGRQFFDTIASGVNATIVAAAAAMSAPGHGSSGSGTGGSGGDSMSDSGSSGSRFPRGSFFRSGRRGSTGSAGATTAAASGGGGGGLPFPFGSRRKSNPDEDAVSGSGRSAPPGGAASTDDAPRGQLQLFLPHTRFLHLTLHDTYTVTAQVTLAPGAAAAAAAAAAATASADAGGGSASGGPAHAAAAPASSALPVQVMVRPLQAFMEAAHNRGDAWGTHSPTSAAGTAAAAGVLPPPSAFLHVEPSSLSLSRVGEMATARINVTMLRPGVTVDGLVAVEVTGGLRLLVAVRAEADGTVWGIAPADVPRIVDRDIAGIPVPLVVLRRALFRPVSITAATAVGAAGGGAATPARCLCEEGLFRLQPAADDVAAARLAVEALTFPSGSDVHVDAADESVMVATAPLVAAHCIKVYLRELPTKLLSTIPTERLLAAASEEECAALVHAHVPPAAQVILSWLWDVLAEVAENEATNRMSAKALAVCLGPNLYESDETANPMEALMTSQKAVNLVTKLVTMRMRERALAPRPAPTGGAAAAPPAPSRRDSGSSGRPLPALAPAPPSPPTPAEPHAADAGGAALDGGSSLAQSERPLPPVPPETVAPAGSEETTAGVIEGRG